MKIQLRRISAFVLALTLMVSASSISFANTGNPKLDKLVELNVILGDGNGVNGEQTMERYRSITMMLRLMGLEDEMLAFNYSGKANFTDASGKSDFVQRLMAYIKANPQLGVVGYPDGSFKPLQVISAKEHAKIMLEVLGYKYAVDFNWDNVSDKALAAGLVLAKSSVDEDTNFTVSDLAEFTYNALSVSAKDKPLTLGEDLGFVVKVTAPIEMKTISATNTNEVTVVFSRPVTSASPVLTIKKGAAMYSSTTTWNATKDTAVLTAVVNLPASDYTVEATGVEATTLTKAFTVSAEVASSIEIPTTSVALKDGATVSFIVKNQYGKDMKINGSAVIASVYNMTQGNAETIVDNAGTESKLDLDTIKTLAKAKLNDILRITVTYAGYTAQAQVTVVNVSENSTIAFGAIEPLVNTTRITAGDLSLKLPYTMFDQFGTATVFAAHAANAYATADVEVMDGVSFVSSNPAVVDVDTMVADAAGAITFNAGAEGTAIITAVINSSGTVANFTVVVNKAGAVENVAVSAPTALIAGGETVKLAFTAADQYGSTILNTDARVTGLSVTSSNQAIVTDANATITDSKLQLVTEAAGSGVVTITVKNGTTTVGSVVLNVEAAATPKQITAVTFPTLFEANVAATSKMLYANLSVIDQYGRSFTLTNQQVDIVAKDGVANIITMDATVINDKLDEKVFSGTATVGTEVFTISLNGVAGSSIDISISTVATADITSYTMTEVGTIYTGAGHAADLVLVGKTAQGKEVVLVPNKVSHATSSDTAIATVTATKVTGIAKGTATVALWSGATKLSQITVTVSDVAPVVTSVTFADTKETTVAALATIDLTNDLVIKDQYGIAIVNAGFWTTSDATKATVAAGIVTGVAAGEVTIGYVSTNGLVVTTKVTVTP